MLNSLTFGRYIDKNSLVHKLDPRVKIMIFIFLMAMVFINIGIISFIIVGVIALFTIALSKIPLTVIWRALLPIIIMGVFILFLNVFISREGTVLFHIGDYPIYRLAFERSLEIFLRIILMVQFTTILTSSTRQIDIAVASSSLLRPFKVIKAPVNEIGIMISITLRFIPTLIEEASIIVDAQSSRGVDFKRGKLKEKLKAIVSLIIPLFVSALSKAEDLSNAMEARGYNPKNERTKYRVIKVKWGDVLSFIFFFLLLVFFICVATVKELEVVRYLDMYFERW